RRWHDLQSTVPPSDSHVSARPQRRRGENHLRVFGVESHGGFLEGPQNAQLRYEEIEGKRVLWTSLGIVRVVRDGNVGAFLLLRNARASHPLHDELPSQRSGARGGGVRLQRALLMAFGYLRGAHRSADQLPHLRALHR